MILGTGAKKGNSNYCTYVAVVLLLLCLCVSSWSACSVYHSRFTSQSISSCQSHGSGIVNGSMFLTCEGFVSKGSSGDCLVGASTNPSRPDWPGFCGSTANCWMSCYQCNTQAEADSVACANNPDLPNCRNACSDYKDECESHGGSWQGSVTSDTTCASTCDLCGTPESQAMREYIYNSCCEGGLTPQYSCGFPGLPSSISGMVYSDVLSMGCNTSNWETQKICDAFYDESSSSQNSSSSTAQSSSSISEYCLIFPNDLACICAENPEHPDCAYLSSNSNSSDSQEPGSSGGGGDTSSDSGGGGSPSSSGGSGGVAGDDWEYDYRDSLHRVINATTRTATNTQAIKENTNGIWNLLKNAKCIFTDCTDYDQLKTALDSSIVIPDGDTAGVIGSMRDMWDSNAMSEFLNAAAAGDINGIGPESLQTALLDFGNKTGQIISDTGVLADEMDKYKEMIEENFPTSQWSYTDACPGALSQNVSFDFPQPIGTINTGKNLGGYFCNPLPPFNITLGNIIRAVIRLALTIAMAMGIFKAATGFNKDE